MPHLVPLSVLLLLFATDGSDTPCVINKSLWQQWVGVGEWGALGEVGVQIRFPCSFVGWMQFFCLGLLPLSPSTPFCSNLRRSYLATLTEAAARKLPNFALPCQRFS